MKQNPDEDSLTFAINHMDYYRANYDYGAKIGQPVLQENEIFLNGKTGHFLIIGAKDPFWCTGVSEQEAKRRIKQNDSLDCLDGMFEKKPDIDPQLTGFGFVDPNKIVQVAAVKKTGEDLGTKNLTSMALRIIAENDIKYWQSFINQKLKDQGIHIADIAYPKIDITAITLVLAFIDNFVDELVKNGITPGKIIETMKKDTPAPETQVFSPEQKIKEIKDRFSPSNVKIAMDISNEGIRAKREERFDDAIRYYQEVIRMFPTAGGIYYNLGKLFYIVGDFPRAQKAYTLAYINGANVFDRNLFVHLGHAVLDPGKNNHCTHEYRKDILGQHGERSPQYDAQCYSCGKERIESLKQAYERELIQL
jgi:tetratricopeptide (TPR) repeat protein